ncbi:efflux RND transporter periplasmic adaptor subunit [bacterium]|nr:efflux RND transporter periplasmic adaptor subunit [bacterium]
MSVKRLKPLAIFVFLLAIAFAAYFLYLSPKAPPDFVETAGVAEATEVELASKIPGRIDRLCCREGERIEKGAIAVRLDERELLARVEQGRAAAAAEREAIEEARTALDNARVEREAAAHEVEALRAEAEAASARFDEARDNFERTEGLFNGGFVSRRELDSARAAYDSSRALLESARSRQRSSEANLRNAAVRIRAAETRISASRARLGQAEAEVRALEARLEDAVLISPISGIISYKSFEAGEYVNPGEVIYAIYDPDDIWARVDIPETGIQEIMVGGRAEVTPIGGERTFTGEVAEIGQLGGFATQRDVTRGRLDIKTFRVRIALGDTGGVLKPGMTVVARIYFGRAER